MTSALCSLNPQITEVVLHTYYAEERECPRQIWRPDTPPGRKRTSPLPSLRQTFPLIRTLEEGGDNLSIGNCQKLSYINNILC